MIHKIIKHSVCIDFNPSHQMPPPPSCFSSVFHDIIMIMRMGWWGMKRCYANTPSFHPTHFHHTTAPQFLRFNDHVCNIEVTFSLLFCSNKPLCISAVAGMLCLATARHFYHVILMYHGKTSVNGMGNINFYISHLFSAHFSTPTVHPFTPIHYYPFKSIRVCIYFNM